VKLGEVLAMLQLLQRAKLFVYLTVVWD